MGLNIKVNKEEKYLAILKDTKNKSISLNTDDTVDTISTDGVFMAVYKTDNIKLEEEPKAVEYISTLA